MIQRLGVSDLLVRFGDQFCEAANRAALAFRAAVEAAPLPGIIETAPSLVSVFLRVDPLTADLEVLEAELFDLLARADWYAAPLPPGRRLIRIPTAYGADMAPDLAETAEAAGLSEAEAVAQLSATRLRVLSLGFGPGQPYLGELPEHWNLPRRTELAPHVPAGALVLAIRQCVLFSRPSPTGWRHVGQTAFLNFRPESAEPFALKPGDELQFPTADPDHVAHMIADPDCVDGGAEIEALP